MKPRRRLGLFASALLVTGVTLLPHDTLEAQRACPNLVMEEPQFTGTEAYKHKLRMLLDSKNEKAEMRNRMESELVEKIDGLGPADSHCVQNVRNAAMQYDIQGVAQASVNALVRFGTMEARVVLHELIANPPEGNFNTRRTAIEGLIKLDPEAAADALLRRGLPRNYYRGMKLYDEMLTKTGSERVLQHYIQYGTTGDVAQFIRWNSGKSFIPNYRNLLMPMLERAVLKESYSPFNYGTQFNCDIAYPVLIDYASAMGALDRVYAEKVLVPAAERSHGCNAYLVDTLLGR